MNGQFPHPAVFAGEPIRRDKRAGSLVRTGLVLTVLATVTALALWAIPGELLSWEAVGLVALGSVLVVLFYFTLGISSGRARDPKTVALVIVWFLISSEAFFMRSTEGDETLHGSFVFGAYAEASMWVLSFAALLIVTLRSPQYLNRMFRGPYKWLSLYGLLCLVSTIFSPQPLFSLAWALKLLVAILLIELYASQVCEVDDITRFLRTLFWAFAFISIAPLFTAVLDPVSMFEEGGRLGGYVSWDLATTESGLLVLLAITLFNSSRSSAQRKLLWVFGGLGAVLMVLYGGKTGNIAGLLGVFLFCVLQKKVGTGLGLVAGIVAIGALILLLTPLGAYLHEYQASGLGSTLTGRTPVWESTVAAIWKRPVFGYGFMATKFMSTSMELEWAAEKAHNVFLEVLYNNGLVGLAFFVAMNAAILKNLSRVIRRSRATASFRSMAAGCLAIQASVLLNGIAASLFGGRVSGPSIMLMALVGVSDWLARANDREVKLGPASVVES